MHVAKGGEPVWALGDRGVDGRPEGSVAIFDILCLYY